MDSYWLDSRTTISPKVGWSISYCLCILRCRISDDVTPKDLWKRLYNAFNYGDVLITLGTDTLSQREETILGLTGRHAYAIIDMKEEDDVQLFLVKNPWANGKTWTGNNEPDLISDGCRATTKTTDTLPAGAFWMNLHKVITYFHTIYLNWNPGLFNYRNDVHFSWDPTVDQNSPFLSNNPQYLLQSREANTVYLVLTRHFQDKESDSGTGDTTEAEFLSLHAYDSSYRVLLRRRRVQESLYFNAPNVLLRLEVAANACYTIVVAEQNLSQKALRFTITSFSLKQLSTLAVAPDEFPFSTTIDGSWTAKSAGGNAARPQHSQNPQFSMTIPYVTDLALILAASDLDIAVHIKVVWSNGKRIPCTISSKDIYGDSGDYSRRCAMMRLQNVPPGTYTVVCSTFEEGQYADFTLVLKSSVSGCILKSIMRDEAGQIVTRLPTAYLRQGVDRLLAPMNVVRNSRVQFIARNPTAAGGNPCSPLRLSIEYGQGPTKETLRDSGEFSSKAELRTAELDLSSNQVSQSGPGVWLVIERVSTSCDVDDEPIDIEILSNIPGVQVGLWGKESDETIEMMSKRLSTTRISNS